MFVRVDEIKVGPRRRQLNLEKVDELAGSIAQVGLLQPIVVTPDGRLVAGHHRLAACQRLGWETIEVQVMPEHDLLTELAEIDENLMRYELTALERAEHLASQELGKQVEHKEE